MRRADENEKERVGQKARIMRKLRRALDDEDLDTARKCVRALDDDDSLRRARRADDDDLDDTELDEDELDDEEADEDDLGGAPRAKRAKKARRARRADDDELEDDEAKRADEDSDITGHGYDDSAAWRTEGGMRKHEAQSRFPIPRFDQSDLAESASRRGYALSDNRLARRAKAIALREGLRWHTVDGRYAAFMMAASELDYRGPRV